VEERRLQRRVNPLLPGTLACKARSFMAAHAASKCSRHKPFSSANRVFPQALKSRALIRTSIQTAPLPAVLKMHFVNGATPGLRQLFANQTNSVII
jgi:hypothetical protein